MEIVRTILPFSNEVANVLTSSGLAIFSGLYKDVPKTRKQKISKTLIDLIALSGIILNAAHTAAKHGETAGITKGVVVILIAFVIPNLTFHTIVKKMCHRCGKGKKLLFGLFLIAILSGLEFLIDFLVVERLHEEKH